MWNCIRSFSVACEWIHRHTNAHTHAHSYICKRCKEHNVIPAVHCRDSTRDLKLISYTVSTLEAVKHEKKRLKTNHRPKKFKLETRLPFLVYFFFFHRNTLAQKNGLCMRYLRVCLSFFLFYHKMIIYNMLYIHMVSNKRCFISQISKPETTIDVT